MVEFLSSSLQALFNAIALNVVRVLAYPINPGERLFVVYLTTSFLMAAAVWKWTARRRSHAARYDKAFAGTNVVPIQAAPGRTHVYHLYVLRVPHRDEMLEWLSRHGVGAA